MALTSVVKMSAFVAVVCGTGDVVFGKREVVPAVDTVTIVVVASVLDELIVEAGGSPVVAGIGSS